MGLHGQQDVALLVAMKAEGEVDINKLPPVPQLGQKVKTIAEHETGKVQLRLRHRDAPEGVPDTIAVKTYSKAKVSGSSRLSLAVSREISSYHELSGCPGSKRPCGAVCHCYGAFQDAEWYYLLLEYCPETLAERLAWGPALSQGEVARLCQQLLEGLRDLHELGWAHTAVSPDAVGMTTAGELRLLDLAGLRPIQDGAMLGSPPPCRLAYLAPEIWRLLARRGDEARRGGAWAAASEAFQPAALDAFQAGLVIIEMVTGRHRFFEPGLSVSEMESRCWKVKEILGEVSPRLTEGIARVLPPLLHPDPQLRAGLQEALAILSPERPPSPDCGGLRSGEATATTAGTVATPCSLMESQPSDASAVLREGSPA